jgi:hypothetical protein
MSTSPIIWNRKREDTGNSTVGFEIFLFYNQPRKRRTLFACYRDLDRGACRLAKPNWCDFLDIFAWENKKEECDWLTDRPPCFCFSSGPRPNGIGIALQSLSCFFFLFFLRIATCILEKVIFNANRSRPIWFLTIYNYNKIKNLFIIAIRKNKKDGSDEFCYCQNREFQKLVFHSVWNIDVLFRWRWRERQKIKTN